MARGPRNSRVTPDRSGLTQFGGLTLIEPFLQRMVLGGSFSQRIRSAHRNNRYCISESLEVFLHLLNLSVARMETSESSRYNGEFHFLAASPGYPEATSLLIRRHLLPRGISREGFIERSCPVYPVVRNPPVGIRLL
jgi:hypothetical protein